MKLFRPKAALLLALCGAVGACTSPSPTPYHKSGVPPAYSFSTYLPDGVANTPNNTGNPASVLDPHTVNMRDVRPEIY